MHNFFCLKSNEINILGEEKILIIIFQKLRTVHGLVISPVQRCYLLARLVIFGVCYFSVGRFVLYSFLILLLFVVYLCILWFIWFCSYFLVCPSLFTLFIFLSILWTERLLDLSLVRRSIRVFRCFFLFHIVFWFI